jgi:hypothetical protein
MNCDEAIAAIDTAQEVLEETITEAIIALEGKIEAAQALASQESLPFPQVTELMRLTPKPGTGRIAHVG